MIMVVPHSPSLQVTSQQKVRDRAGHEDDLRVVLAEGGELVGLLGVEVRRVPPARAQTPLRRALATAVRRVRIATALPRAGTASPLLSPRAPLSAAAAR